MQNHAHGRGSHELGDRNAVQTEFRYAYPALAHGSILVLQMASALGLSAHRDELSQDVTVIIVS